MACAASQPAPFGTMETACHAFGGLIVDTIPFAFPGSCSFMTAVGSPNGTVTIFDRSGSDVDVSRKFSADFVTYFPLYWSQVHNRSMLSWQAMLLNGFFRFTMKRHGKRPLDLRRLRAMTSNPPRRALAVPAGFLVRSLETGKGLDVDLIDQAGSRAVPPTTVVLYLHGGGYLFGSPKTHRQVLIAMAKAFDAPAYGLDYRLAPEHPFPAAVDDAQDAYRWLLARHSGAQIVLAGDSAGGGLAVATALQVRNSGLALPKAIVAFSPYADLAVTGASVEGNAKSCAMFTPRGVREAAALYLAGANSRDPRASPIYADLTGLPPMLLFVSRHEILRDDTLRLAERASAAGVEVQLVVRDRLPHVWPVFVGILPEAREAFVTVSDFAGQLGARNAA
jgi:epsilon-lactone hydrolase